MRPDRKFFPLINKLFAGRYIFSILLLVFSLNAGYGAGNPVQPDSLLKLIHVAPDSNKPKLYDRLAKYYYSKQEYLKAYEYFNMALNAAEKVHDSLFIAKSNNNIAVILDVTGNYSDASDYYKKSLFYFMSLNDTLHTGSVLNNLGVIYEEMQEPSASLEYYRKALKLKKLLKDTVSIAGTLNNIGIIFRNFIKDNDSALFYYEKAKQYYRQKGIVSKAMLCNVNIGSALLDKNEPDKALEYFKKALKYFESSDNPTGKGNALFLTGKVYHLEGDYKKAINYYDSALSIAKNRKLLKLQKNILKNLTDAEENLGLVRSAYDHLKQYEKINDELFNRTKAKLVSEHRNSISIQEKAREVELLKKEEELNKLKFKRLRLIASIAVISTILVLIIAFLIYKVHKQKAIEDLNNLRSQLIRSQLSPHFIFNTLMGIETFLMENKVDLAMDYIVDFAKLIRHILENTKHTFVPLDSELKAMEQYLQLEQMRFSNRFSYEILINTKSPVEELQIPPMLLQPFLENSIVHAFPTLKGRKGIVKLIVTEENDVITILIDDNGIGRKKASELRKKHNSMATHLTLNRLKLLRKRKKVDIDFEVADKFDEQGNAAGTRVIFTIKRNKWIPYR